MARDLSKYVIKSYSHTNKNEDLEDVGVRYKAAPISIKVFTDTDEEMRTAPAVKGGIMVWRNEEFHSENVSRRHTRVFDINPNLNAVTILKTKIMAILEAPPASYDFDYFEFNALSGFVEMRARHKTRKREIRERFQSIDEFEQFLTDNPDISQVQNFIWNKAVQQYPKLSEFE